MRCFLLLRSIFSKNTAFMSIVDRHLTSQISDPAPLILDCQPERHRRVRCIWLVGPHFLSFRGSMTTPSSLFTRTLTRLPSYWIRFITNVWFFPPTGNFSPTVQRSFPRRWPSKKKKNSRVPPGNSNRLVTLRTELVSAVMQDAAWPARPYVKVNCASKAGAALVETASPALPESWQAEKKVRT